MRWNLFFKISPLKIDDWSILNLIESKRLILKHHYTWWHVMKMAAQTQAPAIPLPEAFCKKELLKSWWGPSHEPHMLEDVVDVDVVVTTVLVNSFSEFGSPETVSSLVKIEFSVVMSTILNVLVVQSTFHNFG